MELLAHFTANELVVSLAIYLTGLISGVLLAWVARSRESDETEPRRS
ncbi:MAG: hypothetical protein KY475_03535 [Planctomycetes bacterium]|nr:hypothetical protein [Planctomycetota bacterium]